MKLWLRDETKLHERRTPLTPSDAKKLLDAGVKIVVEDAKDRIFKTQEYKDIGCEIVPAHSWKDAPLDYTILGLKEIEESIAFKHKHIYFAHIYKGQSHAEQILSQYREGGGTLFDLEYLTNADGRRVCAFGRWAGFAGAAFALEHYFQKQTGESYPGLKSFETIELLLERISSYQEKASQKKPKVIVIGALGRCGNGAKDLFAKFDIETTDWDYLETKAGGPFLEIAEHDIFVNCVLVTNKIPPFITKKEIQSDRSQLSLIADVSCDPNSDLNPIPIYNAHTTWESPFLKTGLKNDLEVLAVDNLPSTLPLESSIDFSEQLLPHLADYLKSEKSLPVPFQNAFDTFEKFTK